MMITDKLYGLISKFENDIYNIYSIIYIHVFISLYYYLLMIEIDSYLYPYFAYNLIYQCHTNQNIISVLYAHIVLVSILYIIHYISYKRTLSIYLS